jgi:hypothetical protein
MKAMITESNPRIEAWNKAVEELRGLVPQAVQVLKTGMESDDPKIQQAAALHILRAVGIYGKDLQPTKFDFEF